MSGHAPGRGHRGHDGVPEFSAILEKVVDRYGITVHFTSEAIEIDADGREVVVRNLSDDTKSRLPYDVLHVVPPQSAPDWIASRPLADPANPAGYVEVDKHTLQHTRYPDVFAIGDASNSPDSKTGAAVRHQAPVLVENLMADREGRKVTAPWRRRPNTPGGTMPRPADCRCGAARRRTWTSTTTRPGRSFTGCGARGVRSTV